MGVIRKAVPPAPGRRGKESAMAVGLVIDLDGMTAERYDRLNAEINFPAEPPDGLISHIAGPTDGGFRVLDLWESVEDFDRFVEEQLGPAMGSVSGGAVEASSPQEFPIHAEFHR
jgi:hypothetical protein